MSLNLDVLGVSFEGELPKGLEAMALFHRAAALAPAIGWFEAGDNVARTNAVSLLAGHKDGFAVALETLRGWKADGVEVNKESFLTLFGKPGHYLVPFSATIRVWVESGFLAVPGTLKADK